VTGLDEAAAALAANDVARVEAIAGETLKAQPAHPEALHLLAAALSAQGRATEALAAYQSAVECLYGDLAVTQTPFGDDVVRAVLQLRIDNPERSTTELGAMCDPPMTKDACAGRLRRALTKAKFARRVE
jgi:DNA-binding SARP family transcriptional activator